MTTRRTGLAVSLAYLSSAYRRLDDPERGAFAARFLRGLPWHVTRADVLANLPTDAVPSLRVEVEAMPAERPEPHAAVLLHLHTRPRRGNRAKHEPGYTLADELADTADAYREDAATGDEWAARAHAAARLRRLSATADEIRDAIPEDAPEGFRELLHTLADLLTSFAGDPEGSAATDALAARLAAMLRAESVTRAEIRAELARMSLYRRELPPPPSLRIVVPARAPRAPAQRQCAA